MESGDVLRIAVVNTTPGHPVPDRVPTPGTGPGVDGGTESNGVGLQLVARRLRASYGDAASVSLRRDDTAGVTIAELRLPARALRDAAVDPQRLVS
jgi:LytS/YehU family sensor histidine kinase